jgi:hypothetical protein
VVVVVAAAVVEVVVYGVGVLRGASYTVVVPVLEKKVANAVVKVLAPCNLRPSLRRRVVKNVFKVAQSTLEVTGTFTVYSVALVWVTVAPPATVAVIPAVFDAKVVATALMTAVPTPAPLLSTVGTSPAVWTTQEKDVTAVVVVVVAADAVVTAAAAVVAQPQVYAQQLL